MRLSLAFAPVNISMTEQLPAYCLPRVSYGFQVFGSHCPFRKARTAVVERTHPQWQYPGDHKSLMPISRRFPYLITRQMHTVSNAINLYVLTWSILTMGITINQDTTCIKLYRYTQLNDTMLTTTHSVSDHVHLPVTTCLSNFTFTTGCSLNPLTRDFRKFLPDAHGDSPLHDFSVR